MLNIFKKKMALIADIFLNLRTPKNVLKKTFKKSYFRRPIDKEHGKRTEKLLKSERQHVNTFIDPCEINSVAKNDMQNLRTVCYPLTVTDRYFLLNGGCLLQHLHMQLSQKNKPFCNFFCIFEIYIEVCTFSKKG